MPAELVSVDRATLVAVLVTVTDAFGTSAPLGSLISPVIWPPVWANAMANATPNNPISNGSLRMSLPVNKQNSNGSDPITRRVAAQGGSARGTCELAVCGNRSRTVAAQYRTS